MAIPEPRAGNPVPASMEMPLLKSAPFSSLISSTFLGSSPNEGAVIGAWRFPHSPTKADCLLSSGKERGGEGLATPSVILVLKAHLLKRHKSQQKTGSRVSPPPRAAARSGQRGTAEQGQVEVKGSA